MSKYVIGLDFGTDSVRALIVDAHNGSEVGVGVSYYKRWASRLYCNESASQFRQHPLDYIESMQQAIHTAVNKKAHIADNIVAIGVDTTGSTPVAVDQKGIPLALHPDFKDNPNAMFVLWKDHTAVKEAAEINNQAYNWGGTNYTKYAGGIYSSEWFWAKIIHVLREDEKVREAAYSWVEHCDWIPALLTGVDNVHQVKRSRCAAGHKAMWHPSWGGLPPEEFLTILDPLLNGINNRLYQDTFTSDQIAGVISKPWADQLGINPNAVVGVGAFDAHLGAIGGEIEPFYLSKVMGTSTCDMLIAPQSQVADTLVQGICGQVDGSIIPDYVGLEAGQSGFGDVYAWFRDLLYWPFENLSFHNYLSAENAQKLKDDMKNNLLEVLSRKAEDIDPQQSGVLALDWLNGRRTPDANHSLKGLISGINLGTDAPAIFRALVEATAFGSKRIVERFQSEGIPVKGVIGLGGISQKSPLVMQIMSDILNMPIKIAKHTQTCALGAAMAATVAAGIHQDFLSAQKAMGHGFEKTYTPRPEFVEKYKPIYQKYIQMGDIIEKIQLAENPS